ncbi:hypothetical protein QBC44DRAFT_285472 [Cladorrhinum sp. PSN332]|nr:hypothetical protein QBC44DRAFT_285472 [Cladorrhinum sp. PSN332]
MILINLLPLFLHILPSLAIPAWTIFDIARTCSPDGSSCLYQLDLDQNPDMDTPYSLDDITTCNFPAYSSRSSSQPVPANQTGFSFASCLHTDRFRINGGYNSQQNFWTLVVTDLERGEYAFFGYTDDELQDGSEVVPKRAKVLYNGMERRTEGEGGESNGEGSGGGKEKAEYLVRVEKDEEDDDGNGKTWQIKDLSRVQNESEDTTRVGFKIKDSDGLAAHCTLTLAGSKNDISWFGKACKGFKISWGYKPDTDGSVMTVCYPQNGTAAWFGWDNISYQTDFGDSTRRGLHAIGCA